MINWLYETMNRNRRRSRKIKKVEKLRSDEELKEEIKREEKKEEEWVQIDDQKIKIMKQIKLQAKGRKISHMGGMCFKLNELKNL